MEKKDILIEKLDVPDKTKEILKKAGYNTVGDLALAKVEDIELLFDIPSRALYDYSGPRAFEHLKSILHHDFGVTFLGEYDELKLDPDVATISVSQLQLPNAIKRILNRMGIYTFGDLLATDYQRIVNARNVGEHNLKVLKDYVHGLGYKLKDEEPTLNEILAELKENGVKLLEETFKDSKICMPLYKRGIYTIDDLLNFGPRVYNIIGFGAVRRKELAQKMEELNLTFNIVPALAPKPEGHIEISRPVVAIAPTEEEVNQAKEENEVVKKCVDKKEKLIEEYNRLIEERQQLIEEYNRLIEERQQLTAREEELDRLIESIIGSMKEGISYGRK